MKERITVFSDIQLFLDESNLAVTKIDMERPWGGFFVIDENDAEKFIRLFFPDLLKTSLLKGKLSPKILIVEPEKKLSWQYHFRRSEVWKLIKGKAGVVKSDTDKEGDTTLLNIGDTITLKQGERHRLVGLNDWGVVAEIWIHSDNNHPSDEDDIVRLQDDFGR